MRPDGGKIPCVAVSLCKVYKKNIKTCQNVNCQFETDILEYKQECATAPAAAFKKQSNKQGGTHYAYENGLGVGTVRATDPITLNDIKQIPGVTSIVWALHNKMPGEIWEIDEIQKVADQIHAYGFDMDVVESVNVHDDIKIGLPTRDQYIENYKQCIRNLSKFGVKVICYNFMPIFDWTRTDLFHPVGDGSTALFYEKDKIKGDYKAMAEYIMSFTEKYNMTFPGWEPERMAKLDELFKAYAPVTKEKLWENLKYFLEALMPTCHECDINDGHPHGRSSLGYLRPAPPAVDEPSIDRFLKMVDDPYNCLTLCTGSLNANPNNNCAEIIRKHCDRIAFGHVRNIHHFPNGDFSEAAHRDCCGETGIIEVMRAYHDCGFEGYIRPDHGRQLWEEGPGVCRPGYGKYDRALGIQYMLGIWDLLDRLDEEKKG